MTEVPYTITHVGNKRFVVEWNATESGSTGAPFDASGAKFESMHSFNGFGSYISFVLQCSNENGVPLNWRPPVGSAAGGLLAFYAPYRWFSPIANSAAQGGNTTMLLLFKEE